LDQILPLFFIFLSENAVIFHFVNKNGMTRTHRFAFEEEANILQADFVRESCPNVVSAKAKFLNSCMASFHQSLEEITFIANKDALRIKSYIDDSNDNKSLLHTEFIFNPQDFDRYRVITDNNTQAEVTFCLKEFKATLAFCEAMEQDIHIFFERGGKPILMTNSLDGKAQCTADIVVATLQDDHPSSVPEEKPKIFSVPKAVDIIAGSHNGSQSSVQPPSITSFDLHAPSNQQGPASMEMDAEESNVRVGDDVERGTNDQTDDFVAATPQSGSKRQRR